MADKMNKRKHETLSLAKKIEVLQKLDSGQKNVKLALEYNVGRATIYDIKKNRKKIEHFVNSAGLDASSRHTLRPCEYLLMEDVLYSWFIDERRYNKKLTEKDIKQKSLHFYKEIYKNDNFKASDGWFRNFKTRYGIRGLYDPVIKKKNNVTKDEKYEGDLTNHAATSVKFEESGLKIVEIVPKIEPRDGTTDAQQLTEAAHVETENEAIAGNSSLSIEKKEINIVFEDSNWEDSSSIFITHMKRRMDKLNHQQRFIAEKLMSDVMMLAEANQLQLTSAVVNRPLKQERPSTDRGNDPLQID